MELSPITHGTHQTPAHNTGATAASCLFRLQCGGGGARAAVMVEDNLCNMLNTQMSGSHVGQGSDGRYAWSGCTAINLEKDWDQVPGHVFRVTQ